MTQSPHTFKSTLQAMAFAAAGYSFFAFGDVILKWLTKSYGVSEILFFVGVMGAILTGAIIVRQRGWRGLSSAHLRWHALRTLCAVLSTFFVVHAFSLIPMTDLYGIVFLSPLVIAVMSHFFLGERIGWHRIAAIIAGFCGVIVLAGPQFESHNMGIIYALMSVLFIACGGIAVRKSRTEKNFLLYALYPLLGNALFNLPLMLPGFKTPAPGDLMLIFILIVFSTIGTLFYARGFSRAHTTAVVAPFHYIQMLWGVLFGLVFFGDVPAPTTLAGAAIIIGAGLYLVWREHVHHSRALVVVSAAEAGTAF